MDSEKTYHPNEEADLVDRARRLAYRFARRLVSADDAEDIAQDVAFDCLMKLRKGRLRLEPSLEALVASMTWRKHACQARKEGNRRDVEEQYVAERHDTAPNWMHPARSAERREDAIMHERVVEELPSLTRIVYRMVREQGATHRYTAESMGISVGLVAYHLGRAEKHLMDRLIHVPRWNSTPPTMRRTSRTRQGTTEAGRRTTERSQRTTETSQITTQR